MFEHVSPWLQSGFSNREAWGGGGGANYLPLLSTTNSMDVLVSTYTCEFLLCPVPLHQVDGDVVGYQLLW
jgi:hypothetical protein